MRISRSRLILVSAAILAIAGGVAAAGSLASGLGGSEGIEYDSAAVLYVEDDIFRNLSYTGLYAVPSAGGSVVVEDSLFTRMGFAGALLGTGSGTLRATIEHSRFQDNHNYGA